MSDYITLIVSFVIICVISYVISKLRDKTQNEFCMIEACKQVIEHRFYEAFKHMPLNEKLKEIERLKNIKDHEIIEEFSHPKELRVALKYYVAIMEHDVQLEMALLKINNMLVKMDKDESDNQNSTI